jgi:two-component system response regulator ChvI
MSLRVFVVDDDTLFRESLENNLQDAGFDVMSFENGPTVLDHVAQNGPPNLMLLDWKMPGINGIEVLRQLRLNKVDVPVIFLTVLGDQIYEEAALSSGAVDFVEKSRSFSILIKRIELIVDGNKAPPGAAALTENAGAGVEKIGDLELNSESSRALWNGEEVDLTLTEFKIVRHLARNAGTDVRYRGIYDLVHGEGFVSGYGDEGYRMNVRTFIKRVRKKFRAIDGEFDAIENYPGFGYRWRGDAG